MSALNFDACWLFTSTEEGGDKLSMDEYDPGNWTGGQRNVGALKGTKFGISADAYPGIDIASLTLKQAGILFQRDYWYRMAGNSLAVGIDLMVTDFGFNTGCGTSSRIFQNVVGVNPWQIDGRIGPATLGLAATFQTADLIAKLEAAHEAHYAGNPNFKLYGNGWDGRARRAAVVANQMAAAPPAEDVA